MEAVLRFIEARVRRQEREGTIEQLRESALESRRKLFSVGTSLLVLYLAVKRLHFSSTVRPDAPASCSFTTVSSHAVLCVIYVWH